MINLLLFWVAFKRFLTLKRAVIEENGFASCWKADKNKAKSNALQDASGATISHSLSPYCLSLLVCGMVPISPVPVCVGHIQEGVPRLIVQGTEGLRPSDRRPSTFQDALGLRYSPKERVFSSSRFRALKVL